MKQKILALLLIGGSTTVMAQDTTVRTTQDTTIRPTQDTATQMNTTDEPIRTTTTSTYQAYRSAAAVPQTVQNTFMTEFPAATDAKWEQSNEWYRVHYKQNGQYMRMHYNERGQSFAVALPVRNGLIPDDVINKVIEVYGYDLYDITLMKGDTGETVYSVRVLENGIARSEKINPDGSAYVAPQPMNADSMNMNNNMNMNMNQRDTTNRMDTTNMNMNIQDTTSRVDTTNSANADGTLNNTTDSTGGQQPANTNDSTGTSTDINVPNNPSTNPNQQGTKNKKQ